MLVWLFSFFSKKSINFNNLGNEKIASINQDHFVKEIEVGDKIFIDYGDISLSVIRYIMLQIAPKFAIFFSF